MKIPRRVPRDAFRYVVGAIVCIGHFLGLILIAQSTDRFHDFKDQASSALMLAPIVLVYVVTFVRFVVLHAESQDLPSSSPDKVFYTWPASITLIALVVMFCVAINYWVIRFMNTPAYTGDDLKMGLGVIETFFGGLIGVIFERLFGVKMEEPTNR
jgi:hypothetical protein